MPLATIELMESHEKMIQPLSPDGTLFPIYSNNLLGGCTVTLEVDTAGAEASVATLGFSSTTLTAFAGTARVSLPRIFALDAQQNVPTAGENVRNLSCPSCAFRLSARNDKAEFRRSECSKDKPSKRTTFLASCIDDPSMGNPEMKAGVRAAAIATSHQRQGDCDVTANSAALLLLFSTTSFRPCR